MKRATGAPLWLHKADLELWDNLELQCRTFGVPYTPAPPPDRWLKNDEELSLGEVAGVALHTPGHTPGSMCFHFEAAKLLLAGDTLFRGSIGRTDLWGGDAQAIERAIKALLVLAVKVDMGMRRLRPLDQLILELEGVSHRIPVLRRRDGDLGAIIFGSEGRADPSLHAQKHDHRDQSQHKQLVHSSLLQLTIRAAIIAS